MMEMAKQRGNFMEISGERIDDERARREYFKKI